jgi:hypothetical protein
MASMHPEYGEHWNDNRGGESIATQVWKEEQWGSPAANDANKTPHCEVNSNQAGLAKSVGLELQRQWATPRTPTGGSESAAKEAGAGRTTSGGGDLASQASWQTQSPLGRDADGPADWLDDAELYTTCDNRTDELRLLGNGVVPACAERAFRLLVGELMEHQP